MLYHVINRVSKLKLHFPLLNIFILLILVSCIEAQQSRSVAPPLLPPIDNDDGYGTTSNKDGDKLSYKKMSRTDQQMKAVDNFTVSGVSLKTSLGEFKNKYPTAEKLTTDGYFEIPAVEIYSISNKAISKIQLLFYKQRLFKIYLSYNKSDVEKIGNTQKIINQIEKLYGKPNKLYTHGKLHSITWEFKDPKSPDATPSGKDVSIDFWPGGEIEDVYVYIIDKKLFDSASQEQDKHNRQKEKETDYGFK